MTKYIFETIEVPLIYAQKDDELVGPFLTAMETYDFIFHDKKFRSVYHCINNNWTVKGWKFFTQGTEQITFKNLNIRGAKETHSLIRASSKNPHTTETILYNMDACGYENAELISFDGVKSIMRVECTNVDCHEKMNWEYRHLTLPSYVGAKCEHCKEIYYGYSKLNKTTSA